MVSVVFWNLLMDSLFFVLFCHTLFNTLDLIKLFSTSRNKWLYELFRNFKSFLLCVTSRKRKIQLFSDRRNFTSSLYGQHNRTWPMSQQSVESFWLYNNQHNRKQHLSLSLWLVKQQYPSTFITENCREGRKIFINI